MTKIFPFFLVFISFHLYSEEIHPKLDGILLAPPPKQVSNYNDNANFFIPYNPIIVEVGGYQGENTVALAKSHPNGRVIVFEPNPNAFKELLWATEKYRNVSAYNLALNVSNGFAKLYLCHGPYCNNPEFESLSSLLEEPKNHFQCFKGPIIDVPCVILDDWCKENGVDHIDFIQLDTEGLELQILKSSPEILKTIIVINTKTNSSAFRNGTSQFPELKKYLEDCGFEMLSHWHREGLQGEAMFVRKYIFDALFR